jgi:hypothetical protein
MSPIGTQVLRRLILIVALIVCLGCSSPGLPSQPSAHLTDTGGRGSLSQVVSREGLEISMELSEPSDQSVPTVCSSTTLSGLVTASGRQCFMRRPPNELSAVFFSNYPDAERGSLYGVAGDLILQVSCSFHPAVHAPIVMDTLNARGHDKLRWFADVVTSAEIVTPSEPIQIRCFGRERNGRVSSGELTFFVEP